MQKYENKKANKSNTHTHTHTPISIFSMLGMSRTKYFSSSSSYCHNAESMSPPLPYSNTAESEQYAKMSTTFGDLDSLSDARASFR